MLSRIRPFRVPRLLRKPESGEGGVRNSETNRSGDPALRNISFGTSPESSWVWADTMGLGSISITTTYHTHSCTSSAHALAASPLGLTRGLCLHHRFRRRPPQGWSSEVCVGVPLQLSRYPQSSATPQEVISKPSHPAKRPSIVRRPFMPCMTSSPRRRRSLPDWLSTLHSSGGNMQTQPHRGAVIVRRCPWQFRGGWCACARGSFAADSAQTRRVIVA